MSSTSSCSQQTWVRKSASAAQARSDLYPGKLVWLALLHLFCWMELRVWSPSQFASPCGTRPIRPGQRAARVLAIRAELFPHPSRNEKTWRYARLRPNARLWHCQDHFGLMPNVLYWSLFSTHFNGFRQCRFPAEHIRQITWAQRLALGDLRP